MNVKLVSMTESNILDKAGNKIHPEGLIVYCARVSNPKNQLNVETAAKLLSYCINHGHWSIFEMVDFTVEIQTSRAIAAQVLRHKSASFQEASQRYSAATSFEPVELRGAAEKNRQSSSKPLHDKELDYLVEGHIKNAHDLYEKLLDRGVSKECARMILPLTTQTTLYMKNSVRNWIHYLTLRCQDDTQKEHRDLARKIRDEIFIPNFPSVAEALGWSAENQ
jgi:thymidylate synthase (FAD)